MLIRRDMVRVAAHRNAAAREAARLAREAAYRAETDPMVAQVLTGELPLDDLKAARAAIKARFPYPEPQAGQPPGPPPKTFPSTAP